MEDDRLRKLYMALTDSELERLEAWVYFRWLIGGDRRLNQSPYWRGYSLPHKARLILLGAWESLVVLRHKRMMEGG